MLQVDQQKSVARVLRAIEAIKQQQMVIMVDEEDRENEGDLVFAAQHVSPEKINFMCKEARGLVCLALEPSVIDRLELPLMRAAGKAGASRETAFTVSIEARSGITTGISAADRAHTIKVAIDPSTRPEDIAVPGHVFPLRARAGGVLERAGHTEGSVDLCKISDCLGAAVICEIMNEDGSMARRPELLKMAEKYGLPYLTIPDLIQYRLMQDSLVEQEQRSQIQINGATVDAYLFRSKLDGSRHLALVRGQISGDRVVDVRVHLQRPLLDVFGTRLDFESSRVAKGMELLSRGENVVFIYLSRPELLADSMAHEFEILVSKFGHSKVSPRPDARNEDHMNTQLPNQRLVGIGAQILRFLGVHKMRVHAASQTSYFGLSGFGLEVVEQQFIGE